MGLFGFPGDFLKEAAETARKVQTDKYGGKNSRNKWGKSNKQALQDTPDETAGADDWRIFHVGIGGDKVTGITGESDWDVVSRTNWVNYNCQPGINVTDIYGNAVGPFEIGTSGDQIAYYEYYRDKWNTYQTGKAESEEAERIAIEKKVQEAFDRGGEEAADRMASWIRRHGLN